MWMPTETITGLSPRVIQVNRPETLSKSVRQAAADFARAQVINSARNAASLRPFRDDEFGDAPGRPSSAHVAAANFLIAELRERLLNIVDRLSQSAETGSTPAQLNLLLSHREHAERGIKLIEKIWAFYLELFGQRQSRFAPMLLAADRIALDAYQTVYVGLPIPRSIPSPGAFSYMETGFTPATFRRGIRLSRIGKAFNPFPIVSLPYHRLVNPWTLGAVSHEVSHNLQSDLGLWEIVPQRVFKALRDDGIDEPTAATWARWHKEIWADLSGLLLSGPAVVASLLDVVARSPRLTTAFNPAGVHPTSYLRVLINLELLRRMNFKREAMVFSRLWERMYPNPAIGGIPPSMFASFPRAAAQVVETICFAPYAQLGGKGLADIVRFRPEHYQMTIEAAGRLALGRDPGIMPARYLIGAARFAFDRRLASPDVIARHFYRALAQR